MKNELEKLETAMKTIRDERLRYVEKTLIERGAEADRIAKAAGIKPTAPELTIADYQHIENTYNKPLAELKERHRLAEADAATASVPDIEDQIDRARAAADEAQRVLDDKLAACIAAEGRLKIAQGVISRSKDRGRRIVFQSRLPEITDMKHRTSRDRREAMQKILNY